MEGERSGQGEAEVFLMLGISTGSPGHATTGGDPGLPAASGEVRGEAGNGRVDSILLLYSWCLLLESAIWLWGTTSAMLWGMLSRWGLLNLRSLAELSSLPPTVSCNSLDNSSLIFSTLWGFLTIVMSPVVSLLFLMLDITSAWFSFHGSLLKIYFWKFDNHTIWGENLFAAIVCFVLKPHSLTDCLNEWLFHWC